MSTVLVTGASGFVGAALAPALASAGHVVRATYRTAPKQAPSNVETIVVGVDRTDAAWSSALRGVDAVVHLAGPAHSKFSDAYLQREIADQTAFLAEQAAQAGVARFIFVSSIKATAAHSSTLLRPSDAPAPVDGYGRAKLLAERAVMARTKLSPVVLRPPLVCAADAKANFASLLRLADSPWPLPFAGLRARRSILSRDSLIRAIACVLAKPDGPSGVFHVAERPALTVAEMVTALRVGMGRSPRLFALPVLSSAFPAALRKSLEVDDTDFRAAYGSYADVEAGAMLTALGAAWTTR